MVLLSTVQLPQNGPAPRCFGSHTQSFRTDCALRHQRFETLRSALPWLKKTALAEQFSATLSVILKPVAPLSK